MKREVSAVVSGRGLQGGDQEPGSVRLQRSRPGEGGGGPGHLPGEQAGEWNTEAVPHCGGSLLNGRPFKDATSQNADKHCSNVDNTRKFAPFLRPYLFFP